MIYKLRDYQEISVKKGIDFFNGKSKKNAVLVLPTGSGKSLVIANIAKSLNGNVVVFQPSKELLEQNFEKYTSYGGYAEIYSASAGRKKVSNVTFATIGSVVNKPELFKEFDYCIVDECHLVSPSEGTMYKKFFDALNLKVLGLTATPIRMKRYNYPFPHAKLCMLDRMRPKFFSEYLHITQISEMKKNNFFADVEYINYDFDNSLLTINSTGGDYTERSISEAMQNNSVLRNISDLYDSIVSKGKIKHILVFVESIESAFELQKMIGVNNCAVITGKTKKKERKKSLSDFKNKRINCVINVGVLTTGFDFPELDCLIIARPTMSLGLYYQIVGRGVRPHPDKEKTYVFDFVGNYDRFGKVEDLVIEKQNNLYVIHNGSKVLTNVDISEIGTQPDINDEPVMSFGKHKGKPLSEIKRKEPKYVAWFLDNVEKNKYNEFIFKAFE